MLPFYQRYSIFTVYQKLQRVSFHLKRIARSKAGNSITSMVDALLSRLARRRLITVSNDFIYKHPVLLHLSKVMNAVSQNINLQLRISPGETLLTRELKVQENRVFEKINLILQKPGEQLFLQQSSQQSTRQPISIILRTRAVPPMYVHRVARSSSPEPPTGVPDLLMNRRPAVQPVDRVVRRTRVQLTERQEVTHSGREVDLPEASTYRSASFAKQAEGFSDAEMRKLTDNVVTAINQRIVARRERMGRI